MLTNGLGQESPTGRVVGSVDGGMDMVVEQVGGQDREIKCELSGASSLVSETKN